MKDFFITTRAMQKGFFLVEDTSNRVHMVLFSDSVRAFLPGSETVWTPEMVEKRFYVIRRLDIEETHGPYSPEMFREPVSSLTIVEYRTSECEADYGLRIHGANNPPDHIYIAGVKYVPER